MDTSFVGGHLSPVDPALSSSTPPHKGILIVDPEDTLTWSLSRGLFRNRPDIRIWVAHQGSEALQRLKEEKIDLVLSEVKLPDLHWADFLREVPRIAPQARVIIMACHCYRELESLARARGAKDWVNKPFEIAQLRETIAQSLDVSPASCPR